jgi:hypothetical protein
MSLTNTINFRNLQGDLFGGLTAAIVSLALAFSVASSAGSVAVLDVAVGVGFFAALFGQIRDHLRWADTPSHNPIARGQNQASGGISRLVYTP